MATLKLRLDNLQSLWHKSIMVWQFILTILGGFIAGVVGLIVARWQWNRQQKDEKENRFLEILGHIKAFSSEISEAITIAEAFKAYNLRANELDPHFGVPTTVRDHNIGRFSVIIQDPGLLEQLAKTYFQFDRLNRYRDKNPNQQPPGSFIIHLVEEAEKGNEQLAKIRERIIEEDLQKLVK